MPPRILAATHKGVFTIAHQAGRWQVQNVAFLGDDSPIVLPDRRDGRLYAALHHGHFGDKLHRSVDGGATWQECAVPVYPAKPEGADDSNPMSGKSLEWKLHMIWALEAGHPSEPGVLWCGTMPGGLFKSTDCGDSWEMVRTLWDDPRRKEWFGGGADQPGIHSVCVDPRDGRHVSVGVSCGGVWVTRDGGQTWDCKATGMWAAYMPPEQKDYPNIQDAHRIVQCPGRPDCYWAQHHNGVFRTTDDCESWQEVKDVQPSVFGFAVAVHPRDPETAWTIPAIKDERRIPVDAKLVVSRTSDGGKTWQVLRNGLPHLNAYDLVFRHGLDIDADGHRLAFGSTTGGFWVTEDQGDSWQCVSEHLPPVFCVRFVN